MSLLDRFLAGGFFMWPIAVFAALVVVVGFERVLSVVVRSRLDADRFMSEVLPLIRGGKIEEARTLCALQPHAALPRVVAAAVGRAGASEADLSRAVDEATLGLATLLNRRTPYLSMLANVATLTGLLGTIQGLIQAFDAVSDAPPETKQAMLASGIAVAMYTTFGGLVVAIPALMLHAFVGQQANRTLDDLERYGVVVIDALSRRG